MFLLDSIWKRTQSSDIVSGGNEAFNMSYNRASGAMKHLNLNGMLSPIGDCAALKVLPDYGFTVALYNPSSTATVYAAFGTISSPANPTGGTDGIAIPPLSYMYLSAGSNLNVKTTGQCFGYILEDDTYLAKKAS